VAFVESGEGASGGAVCYLRNVDGSPAVALGQGRYPTFAPDGQSVVVVETSALNIYPVGAGESKHVSMPGFILRIAGLLPDEKRIWFNGSEGSHPGRLYLTDIAGAKPRAITPEGVSDAGRSLLLDGRYLAGRSQAGLRLYPIDGGEPISIPSNTGESSTIAGSAEDGHTLFLATGSVPSKIYSYDVKTGAMQLITEVAPADRAGVLGGMVLRMAPNGKSYAYSYAQELSELNWVEGLK
jgi:hypothetical protein